MKIVGLTQGKCALVDDADFEYLNKYRWFFSKKGYAVSHLDDHKSTRYMHRLVMGFPDGLEVDHVNHNTLDNQKDNLRACNHSTNMKNSSIRSHNKSGYLGVCWNNQHNKWRAYIQVDGIQKHLGLFDDISDAVNARISAKEVFHGF